MLDISEITYFQYKKNCLVIPTFDPYISDQSLAFGTNVASLSGIGTSVRLSVHHLRAQLINHNVH